MDPFREMVKKLSLDEIMPELADQISVSENASMQSNELDCILGTHESQTNEKNTRVSQPSTSSFELLTASASLSTPSNCFEQQKSPNRPSSSLQRPKKLIYEYEEPCPICGDKITGYHYGILTCESCKGFFKRTVQNKKKYQCIDLGDCVINKIQRKRCPSCRYQKCMRMGMKLEAVREDRLRGGRNKFGPLYKHDRALKMQNKTISHPSTSSQNDQPPESEYREVSRRVECDNCSQASSSGKIRRESGPSSNAHFNPYRIPPHLFDREYDRSLHHERVFERLFSERDGRGGPGAGPRYPYDLAGYPPFPPPTENERVAWYNAYADSRYLHGSVHSTLTLPQSFKNKILYTMVVWAKESIFFNQIQTEEQVKIIKFRQKTVFKMVLLRRAWIEIMILDHIYRQIWFADSHNLLLVTGRVVPLVELYNALDTSGTKICEDLCDIADRFRELQIDRSELMCLKFLILFSSKEARGNSKFMKKVHERINSCLLEYTQLQYPDSSDRYVQNLMRLPGKQICP
ncbi:unnamed protein product [Oikopleura dioica]|uniref:Nuclear receptor domain-containing protein n=1 Tax=Oikopleura dioica TaxID=34765 RepID=E4XQU8_OIKDI|nr:unnamed protein product [Oikopleura dioica]